MIVEVVSWPREVPGAYPDAGRGLPPGRHKGEDLELARRELEGVTGRAASPPLTVGSCSSPSSSILATRAGRSTSARSGGVSSSRAASGALEDERHLRGSSALHDQGVGIRQRAGVVCQTVPTGSR